MLHIVAFEAPILLKGYGEQVGTKGINQYGINVLNCVVAQPLLVLRDPFEIGDETARQLGIRLALPDHSVVGEAVVCGGLMDLRHEIHVSVRGKALDTVFDKLIADFDDLGIPHREQEKARAHVPILHHMRVGYSDYIFRSAQHVYRDSNLENKFVVLGKLGLYCQGSSGNWQEEYPLSMVAQVA